MLRILFLLLPFFGASPEADHAVYISVLEIDQQQMKVKVFEDNLQDALRNDSNTVEGYFRKKIKLKINGNAVGFDFENKKVEGDSYWITFRLHEHEEWQSFSLEANYFMELFPDQTNVVKVLTEEPQFFRLSIFNPKCSFTL